MLCPHTSVCCDLCCAFSVYSAHPSRVHSVTLLSILCPSPVHSVPLLYIPSLSCAFCPSSMHSDSLQYIPSLPCALCPSSVHSASLLYIPSLSYAFCPSSVHSFPQHSLPLFLIFFAIKPRFEFCPCNFIYTLCPYIVCFFSLFTLATFVVYDCCALLLLSEQFY